MPAMLAFFASLYQSDIPWSQKTEIVHRWMLWKCRVPDGLLFADLPTPSALITAPRRQLLCSRGPFGRCSSPKDHLCLGFTPVKLGHHNSDSDSLPDLKCERKCWSCCGHCGNFAELVRAARSFTWTTSGGDSLRFRDCKLGSRCMTSFAPRLLPRA